jgi:hypothetical protein
VRNDPDDTPPDGSVPDRRDHVRGSGTAGVTLVEYGDCECSYCGEAHAPA